MRSLCTSGKFPPTCPNLFLHRHVFLIRITNIPVYLADYLLCTFKPQVQVSIGERHMVGVATGTAVFLSALPPPALPTTSNSNITSKQSKRGRIQKLISEAHANSKDHYGLNKALNKVLDMEGLKGQTDSEDSDEDANDLDLSTGNKDTCVLEVETFSSSSSFSN